MSVRKLRRNTAVPVVFGVTVSVAVGVLSGTAGAASGQGGTVEVRTAPAQSTQSSRQLLGQVSRPTYLEASTPAAGVYAIEYDIKGTAFFDTYLDGTELGYVGGPTGTYRTRSISLTAGGHLVQVTGPDGSGTASVYLVRP